MAKEKTHVEAVAELEAAKETLKSARAELRNFKSENNVKKGKEPEDEKVKKGLAEREAAVEKAQEALDAAREVEKGLKPKKDRALKYEYPEGMTEEQKKKFRAKKRREAKAAAKKAEKGEEPAADKAADKPKAGGKKKVVSKKGGKVKPATKVEED